MEIKWSISNEDIRELNEFVSENKNDFLKVRKRRNIEQKDLAINKDYVIKALLMCCLLLNNGQDLNQEYKVFKKNTIPDYIQSTFPSR